MASTKKVTITLSPEQQDKAREMSKDLFGRENISGLIGFLIERWEKENKKTNSTMLWTTTNVANIRHNDCVYAHL